MTRTEADKLQPGDPVRVSPGLPVEYPPEWRGQVGVVRWVSVGGSSAPSVRVQANGCLATFNCYWIERV